MKIDLGTGLIDAYNFKLMSKNVLIDSTENADTFFEVKGYNAKSTDKDKYYSLFKVYKTGSYHKAMLAGWHVDWNSIRIGDLGKAGSYWMCRDGTSDETPAPADFVGGATSGWCLTIGKNFGVNKDGEMFGRGVTIKDGDISIIEENTENIVFSANRKGEL
jgi:hypothetical protein